MDAPIWLLLVYFGLGGLALASWIVLVADSASQIVAGRPAFIPLEAALRNRRPATAADCVIQGASKGFLAIGMALLLAGTVAISLISLVAPSVPPLSHMPRPFLIVLLATWVGSLFLGFVCMILGTALAWRVRYVPAAYVTAD